MVLKSDTDIGFEAFLGGPLISTEIKTLNLKALGVPPPDCCMEVKTELWYACQDFGFRVQGLGFSTHVAQRFREFRIQGDIV